MKTTTGKTKTVLTQDEALAIGSLLQGAALQQLYGVLQSRALLLAHRLIMADGEAVIETGRRPR